MWDFHCNGGQKGSVYDFYHNTPSPVLSHNMTFLPHSLKNLELLCILSLHKWSYNFLWIVFLNRTVRHLIQQMIQKKLMENHRRKCVFKLVMNNLTLTDHNFSFLSIKPCQITVYANLLYFCYICTCLWLLVSLTASDYTLALYKSPNPSIESKVASYYVLAALYHKLHILM